MAVTQACLPKEAGIEAQVQWTILELYITIAALGNGPWSFEKVDRSSMPPLKKMTKYLGGMKRRSKKLKASNPKRYVVLEYDIRKDSFVFQNLHRPSKLML